MVAAGTGSGADVAQSALEVREVPQSSGGKEAAH